MVNYNLISDIALGDTHFTTQVLSNFITKSEELLISTERLLVDNKWSLLHLKLRNFRNRISPFLNKPSLNKINAVLEILSSSLNSSAKEKAYIELTYKIKRDLKFLTLKLT